MVSIAPEVRNNFTNQNEIEQIYELKSLNSFVREDISVEKNVESRPLKSILKTEKLNELKFKLNDLLSRSSAHGIPNIVASNNLFIKTMWFIIFCLSTVVCFYLTIMIIFDYLEFATVTTLSIIPESQSQFPTITFCGNPAFNKSIDQIIISTQFEQIRKNETQNYEELNDLSYGRCFRYNSGRNLKGERIDLLNSTASGYFNRLRISFYLDIPEDDDFAEILFFIHNSSSYPLEMENEGYWIRPGTWNYYQIEKVFSQLQGEPYNDCLSDINLFARNKTIIKYLYGLNRTYSQKDCFYKCAHLFAIKESNCNCSSSFENFEKHCIKHYIDEQTDSKKCVANYTSEFRSKFQKEKCSEYCPLECNSMSYTISSYIENLPPHGNISEKRRSKNELLRFKTYEEANKHFVVLAIYFKDLSYTLVSQEKKTELFNFVSNIGGIFSLFWGISFMSFIEIFEILFEIFFILFRK